MVVDNVARGPAIGGVRMAADVSVREVVRLPRAMTLKNAMADLAHGGGKSAILLDPNTADKERVIRTFARGIRELVDYIPGPDMGTNELCMGRSSRLLPFGVSRTSSHRDFAEECHRVLWQDRVDRHAAAELEACRID